MIVALILIGIKAENPEADASGFSKLAPQGGFEPPAKRLTVACSTAELLGNSMLMLAPQRRDGGLYSEKISPAKP